MLMLGASFAALASSSGCSQTERTFGSGGAGGAASTASSSSSGGGSASASSSSGGGATASSSSGGGVETDCTNGIDDDHDGLTDCADPDCINAGYQCAADTPAGWSGPALLHADLSAPPGCGSDWTMQPVAGGLDVSSPLAKCSACACSTPSGATCQSANVKLANDPACANGPMMPVPLGACIPGQSASAYVAAGPVIGVGGGCAPAGGAASLLPAGFMTQAAVCAAPAMTGKGCNAGACVPRVPMGYGPKACVYAPGDPACPGAPYLNKTLVYTGIDDQRSCSSCACGVVAGETCSATLLVFSGFGQGCSGALQTLPANGQCHPVQGPSTGLIVKQSGPPMGGSCATSGGKPAGMATGAKPITVCCE